MAACTMQASGPPSHPSPSFLSLPLWPLFLYQRGRGGWACNGCKEGERGLRGWELSCFVGASQTDERMSRQTDRRTDRQVAKIPWLADVDAF